MPRSWLILGVPLAAAIALGACSQSNFDDFPTPGSIPGQPEGPGHPAWGSTNLSCEKDSDCAPNENCNGSICMPVTCSDGAYDSSPPFGPSYRLLADREIVAADSTQVGGGYWIDGYAPVSNQFPHDSGASWKLSSEILDIASGNLLATRPDATAAIISGSSAIHIRHSSGSSSVDLEFVPERIAVGDTDQDGVDNVVVLGGSGDYAICDIPEKHCDYGRVDGATQGYDVSVGDIDGDFTHEAIFHVRVNGDPAIVALNADYESSGEPQWLGGPSERYLSIAAGLIDDSGRAKVFALLDGGGFGWFDDEIETLDVGTSSVVTIGSVSVDEDSKDIAARDIDTDGRAELALVYNDRNIEIRRPVSPSSHQITHSSELSASQTPNRIALSDIDGDSPIARLIAGPELISGGITPIAALQFPPYSATFSEQSSYLYIGKSDTSSEGYEDSMSVRYGGGVGFQGSIANVVKTSFMQRFGQEWSRARSLSTRQTVGARFSIRPDIDNYGNEYSVVMIAAGCFHSYGYEIDDPAGILDNSLHGTIMGMTIPVGGRVSMWSSMRYNALAQHLGTLPIIETPVRIGDPDSYPDQAMTTSNTPVLSEDQVFPNTPILTSSDVAIVGHWLSVGDSEVNESKTAIDIAGYGYSGIGPVSVNYDYGLNQGTTHSISIGSNALFGGFSPAIPDDPDTPEDETTAHGFDFSPTVHKEYYLDANGKEAGYYVLSYSVSR